MSNVELKVINNNPFPLRGRFDGEDYLFPPKKPVCISLDAAKHIFGLGDEDKAPALNKLGLLIPGKDTVEQALAKLDNISFIEGRTVFDDEEGGEETDVDDEETPTRRGPKKTGGRPHVASPGGESPAGASAPAGANP
jgi:hypothetical protein